jgi:hypothetical protein
MSLGLVVFGLIEILIGVFLALLVPLMVVAALAAQKLDIEEAGLDLGTTVVSGLTYGAIAVLMIWIGIGSIRARKWARAVMLSVSWLWLITGAVSMVIFWIAMPRFWAVAGVSDLVGDAQWMVTLTTTLFVGLIYVVLPLAFVVFYRLESVAATCRARDTGSSWVDGRPQGVINLVVVCWLIVVSFLIVPLYGFLFPLCGLLLAGWAGAVGWAAVLGATLSLLHSAMTGDRRGWTVAMVVSVLVAASFTITSALVPYVQWIEGMNLPPEQREVYVVLWNPDRFEMAVVSLLFWATWIGYMLYVKRYFEDRTG